MTNKTENVHEETNEGLQQKAQKIVELLNEEPKAQIDPFLRVTEKGIVPDVRLVLINDTDEESAGEGSEDADGGDEPAGDAEPSEPQDTTG